MTTQDQIIALADELGGEVRLDYSGRGMFGARCLGIVCEDSEEIIRNALGRGLPRGKVDSMGTRKIVYWPEIKAAMRSVGLLPGSREVDLLADNERLRAALTSFIETWDALPDECRRAANGATNFGRLITTLRAALAGEVGK